MSCFFSSMRLLVSQAVLFFATLCKSQAATKPDTTWMPYPGDPMPAWQSGFLDIHHINTGRGNAAFVHMPDGTSLLIDAGELSPLDPRTHTPRNAAPKPDSSRKPFEWIADYIRMAAPEMQQLDYALLTHFHDDHFGAWYPAAPESKSGKFQLTGITGLGDRIRIGTLIDRGAPDYNYPYAMRLSSEKNGGGEIRFGETMANYFRFIDEKKAEGMKLEALKAGSHSQIVLRYKKDAYPDFVVQNIKSNDRCWTGQDTSTLSLFPQYRAWDQQSWPDENALSLALLIRYGTFRYYTGGDNPGMLNLGTPAWRDTETPMAMAVGEVDVATMDHHGNRDAINENQVRLLKPRVWIGQSWSSDHPGHEVLLRMLSPHLYKGPRDLFATNMLEANRLVIGPLIDRAYQSQQGHILLRVKPGGSAYALIILDDSDAQRRVKSVFGPYTSKQITATLNH